MTSHAVSRGRLAPLVGRRFVVVGLRMYFVGIQSLFAFISLTHKCGRLVLLCYHQTKGQMKKNLVECVQL